MKPILYIVQITQDHSYPSANGILLESIKKLCVKLTKYYQLIRICSTLIICVCNARNSLTHKQSDNQKIKRSGCLNVLQIRVSILWQFFWFLLNTGLFSLLHLPQLISQFPLKASKETHLYPITQTPFTQSGLSVNICLATALSP